MRTVSVVVATHQGKRFLRRCLRALATSELPLGWELEPIVVDNGSNDGTEELLASEFPAVRRLIVRQPLGFARANNAARTLATGEIVAFLNNDTEVTPTWLVRPIALLETDPRISAVGSLLIFMHRFRRCTVIGSPGTSLKVSTRIFGNDLDCKVRWSPEVSGPLPTRLQTMRVVPSGGSIFIPDPLEGLDPTPHRPPVFSLLMGDGLDASGVEIGCGDKVLKPIRAFPCARVIPETEERVEVIQAAGGFVRDDGSAGDHATGLQFGAVQLREATVPTACGAAFVARRSALDAVGWFPECYHVYYEDTHLATSLRSRGGLIVFCPSSVVRHYHTGTNREFSPFFTENVARSQLTFSAHFCDSRVLLRQFAQAGVNSVREIAPVANRPLRDLWKASPGFRGVVKSVPAVTAACTARALRLGARHAAPRSLRALSLLREEYVAPPAVPRGETVS